MRDTPKLFGTDGIRGIAGSDLTAELATEVGRAVASLGSRPSIVIGRDTRVSGLMLEEALAAGLTSMGADVLTAGVLPTPGVAFLVVDQRADAGAVISASHNPPEYNGIKFFGPDGRKLSDVQEEAIEALLGGHAVTPRPGTARNLPAAEDAYVTHVLQALDGRSLDGIRVVIDCGNGAAFRVAPRAVREAGAEVVVLNDRSDGAKINVECGSTHPEVVAKAVLEHSADVGLAHDGDADRVVAVDEGGDIVDGDEMLAALAIELKELDRLAGDLVVTTVMTNLGFRKAMSARGIEIVETAVGDRYVADAMLEHHAVIGGEQSGHLVFTDYATTGDGLITGLRLLARMVSTGKRLSELTGVVEKYPQVLVNIPVANPGRVTHSEQVRKAVEAAEVRLGHSGRVLVRPSGTEPLVRVMVEAAGDEVTRSVAEEIAEVVKQELGGDA